MDIYCSTTLDQIVIQGCPMDHSGPWAFALAFFHLVFLVLVGGWGVSFLVIRSDKISSDLVRSGQIRSGQTRSDQGRSGQGWSLCYVWDDHGVEILILSRWGNIENPYSYVVEDCVIVLT